MTKRSLQHSLRQQPGCMWSLMSIFDFRQGRSSAKLLSDRRRERKHAIRHSSSQKVIPNWIENLDYTTDGENDAADAASSSVKELMAVEMINENGFSSNGRKTNSERAGFESEKGVKNKRNRRNRDHIKSSSDLDVAELNGAVWSAENVDAVPKQNATNNLDLEAAIEELVRISRRNTRTPDGGDGDSPPDVENLVAALKLVMHSREERDELCAEDFMDAVQTLSENKGLFLKLLRDQNSALVKHFQKLVDTRGGDDDQKLRSVPKHNELRSRRQWNFFRRSKSVESLEWNKDYTSPGRIVVLKPSRETAHRHSPVRGLSASSDYDKENGNRIPSYFSFTNFKQKLRNAMGKERRVVSSDGQSLRSSPSHKNGKSSPGWSSPNRNHFYTERFTLFSPSFKLKERSSESPRLSRLGGSDIHTEAKKHLSESLSRIISFHDQNRCHSPRKTDDDIFITPEMRFSPLGKAWSSAGRTLQEKIDDCSSLRKRCSSSDEEQSPVKDGLNSSPELECSVEDDRAPEASEIEEVAESRCREDKKIIDDSFAVETREGDVESEESTSHESDSIIEVPILSHPPASPSCSSESREVEEDSYPVIDKTERPSPVSVLYPLFADDDLSPASTVSQPEKELQPLRICFEEQPCPIESGLCMRISSEDEESAFEYVEAVLLGSGLNWDEYLTRWVSSYDILDSSLFDEVALFSSRPCNDQKLLFDCANEALEEVCEEYFGQFSGVFDGKRNIRPVPRGMDLIRETWKLIDGCTLRNPKRCSLEQLIEMDMGVPGNWMKLRSDVEVVGFVVTEATIDELVEDFVLSLVDEVLLPDLEVESDAS
ncbi:uncharacterized protein LOC127262398 isoform X2 [Andrographis paniculata]|uniref:uncharacterized protein LOC127262398 isoform X2 n=1 Tax=Andrographis paniculata TaxID=175694 RepID=UPI0021E7E1D0|nr:uncharacterized protein LOC127262398 isoform X2 [Andrographis paniculata]